MVLARDDARLRDALLLLLASIVALVLVRRDADPDIFGRVAYARDAFARGAWTWHTDPYSYTVPGGAWVDHEWGFSWIAFAAFKVGGWSAIRLLRVALMAATAWMCVATTRRLAEDARITPLLGFFLAPVLALAFIGPRAQAFSYLFFAWMLWSFARARDGSPVWMLWGVAPMPLWVNVHGGFLAGMGVAVLWLALQVPGFVRRHDRHGMHMAANAVAWCLASALLQPWGWDYALVIAQAGTMARPFVNEWNPPPLLGVHWVMAVIFTLLTALSALVAARRWPDLAVLAVLAVESFLHRRHLTFLAIAAAVFAVPVLAEWWNARRAHARPASPQMLTRGLTAVAAIAALPLVVATVRLSGVGAPRDPAWPAAAVAFLRTQPGGGVLADFEWGQYVILEASPKFTVAMDGRYEEVYPDEVVSRYVAWHFGFTGWESLPSDSRTAYALVATGSDRAKRLDTLAPKWRQLYADATATVFVKAPVSGP